MIAPVTTVEIPVGAILVLEGGQVYRVAADGLHRLEPGGYPVRPHAHAVCGPEHGAPVLDGTAATSAARRP